MSSWNGLRGGPSEGTSSTEPAAIRIRRKASGNDGKPFGPPPVVPPANYDTEEEKAAQTSSSSASTATLPRDNTLRKVKERDRLRERENSSDKEKEKEKDHDRKIQKIREELKPHTPLGERTSYVEEPPSNNTTLERRERKEEKERALVRRITNEMQIAHYVHKMDIAQANGVKINGGYSNGVYRMRSLRFFESATRQSLWYLGKIVANHKLLFTLFPLMMLCLTLVGPILYRENLKISLPFASILAGKGSDIISNDYGIKKILPEFNYSNPAYTMTNWMDPEAYAILLKTLSNRDTILRRDAVLAYTALKKKLDNFPVGHKEFLDICPADCEAEKDMVDRIVKKSAQVALTYPETFVSMSKDSNNLTRVFLGATIGGVETDTDGAIARAQALLMSFHLRNDLTDEQRAAWEQHYQTEISMTSASNMTLSFWSPSEFTSTVIRSLSKVHIWLAASAMILMLFCVLASFGINSYQSKPLVGLQMGIVLLLSCGGAMLLEFFSTTHYNVLLWPVFFTIMGIGLLWLFSLHLAWGRFSFAAVHPTEKLAFILSHDGPGIVLSAVVIVVTFLLMGVASSDVPLMQSTFIVICLSVAILLALAITYLAVFIYIGGRREAKGVKWYQLFKTGDTHFTTPNLTDFDSTSLFSLHDRLLDSRPSLTRAIGSRLVAPNMRYPIVFFCTAYIMVAIWGCSNIRIDLREEYFLPVNSPSSNFLEQYNDMYGKQSQFLTVMIDQPVEYYDETIRQSLSNLMESTILSGHAARSVSWLNDFVKFEAGSIYEINPDTFVPVLTAVFLTSDPYKRYSADITFDRSGNQITRSRMYLELTKKGVDERVELIENLMTQARDSHLSISIKASFTTALQHDIKALSIGIFVFGVSLVLVVTLSLLLFGQPSLTLLLGFTSISVILETVGYAVHWGVPLNVITFTMILAGNALTCVIVMAFCYSYSISGRSQIRAGVRVQYTFQATLLPVLFACLVPVITYFPLFAVDAPLIHHLWKIILLNSAASLIHYLFFLPNLLILIAEHFPMSCSSLNCAECCCDMEDESSIYYIPTTGRAVHPEGIYHQASYTYSVPKTITTAPPNYLAIAGPPSISASFVADYGRSSAYGRKTRRTRSRRHSECSGTSATATPKMDREKRRTRRKDSESIYEAPPSPRQLSSRSASPRRSQRVSHDHHQGERFFDEPVNMHPLWRSYGPPQPFMYYPRPPYVPSRR